MNKERKSSGFFCFFAILIFVFILGCSGGKTLSGTWEGSERGWGEDYTIIYNFSGKNYSYTRIGGWRGVIEQSGTYSISGDQIEFVDSDGDIEVHYFSRTENTIAIDSVRLTRQK